MSLSKSKVKDSDDTDVNAINAASPLLPSYFSSGRARMSATDFPVSSARDNLLFANVSGATSSKMWCVASSRRSRATLGKLDYVELSVKNLISM